MAATFDPGLNSPALHHYYNGDTVVHFQEGPILEYGVNGVTNEEMIEMLIQRIESLNTMEDGKFACYENDRAIDHLHRALQDLHDRTARRVDRGVEGTNTP